MNTFDLADLIRECCARSGLDQRGLSEKARISEVTISRIMNDHSDGSGKTLRKLRTFLATLPPQVPTPSPPEAA